MLTKREAAIVSAYTGYLLGEFADMHDYVEEVMGRPVFTHEMGEGSFTAQLRLKTKADFISLDVSTN